MKVKQVAMQRGYIIPGDEKLGIKDKPYDYIGKANVVEVDELLAYCKEHPDLPCETLAICFEKGEFA